MKHLKQKAPQKFHWAGVWTSMRQLETEVEGSEKKVRRMREDMRKFINTVGDLRKELLTRDEEFRKLRKANE